MELPKEIESLSELESIQPPLKAPNGNDAWLAKIYPDNDGFRKVYADNSYAQLMNQGPLSRKSSPIGVIVKDKETGKYNYSVTLDRDEMALKFLYDSRLGEQKSSISTQTGDYKL